MNQAGLLLAIYEEGNGLGEVAYQSIGYCPRTGYIWGWTKLYVNVALSQEQRKSHLIPTNMFGW